ncbi:MAG TPA: alpha-L-fucosidase, partial [Acidobacteriota bacterium]|nr:alpha-L-fucosidase [Acidobacteriota bacterium]
MTMRRGLSLLLAAVALCATVLDVRAGNSPKVSAEARAGMTAADAGRLAWWREGRFGLFIHWGPVSLKGTEISWSRANSNPLCPNKGEIPVEVYDNLYKSFNPTLFDADAWAAVAKDAGMRYVVLTAKHCDGFCLWPTQTIDYHIGATPFRRDVCGELAEALRKAGLRIGWYYSPMDWRDPDCRNERNAAYVRRMQGQIRELVTRFGRIDLLWFDWDGGTIPWDQEATYRIVRQAQPAIIINNRLDCSFGGLSADRDIGPNADYLTPEQVIGAYNDRQPWETCMTLGTQWSWKPDDRIKSVDEVIRILAGCAGGDGNLLLNVGPMPDGRIEPRQVEVLKGVGAWLGRNGESIYGTRGGPFKPGRYGASTRRGDRIYLHVFAWEGPSLELPAIPLKVVGSRILGGGRVSVRQTGKGLAVTVPEGDRHPADTVVVLELDGPASGVPAMDVPGQALKKA